MIDVWMIFSLIIPTMEIFLHALEDSLIRQEVGYNTSHHIERRYSDTLISVNNKVVKVLPAAKRDSPDDEEDKIRMRKWTLESIDFVGNVVILVCIVVFTTCYFFTALYIYFRDYK